MASTKQFVNDPADFVPEALEGFVLAHSNLVSLQPDSSIVIRVQPATNKVGLVSGGGSGHEPLHIGFVGVGMLDVAVPGAVFASPTAYQIHAGTIAANSGKGVLHIVKNYTGDVLNFSIAAELAADDGIEVKSIIVDDDLATDGTTDGPGRRGTAAVVTVEKICGAAAEEGASLKALEVLGNGVIQSSKTMSLALSACTHPGSSRPAFDLAPDEVEFGIGIHGERGISRIEFAEADILVEKLVDPIVGSIGLNKGDRVIAIVNGLGGAYPLELAIINRALHAQLKARGIEIARQLLGTYVTSLDMHGVSITLTKVDNELIRLWDSPVHTAAIGW